MDLRTVHETIQLHCPDWLEVREVWRNSIGRLHVQFVTNWTGTSATWQSISFDTDEDAVNECIEVLNSLGGEPMNIFGTDLFKYISGEMIGDKDATKVIDRVALENVRGQNGDEQKPVLYFKGSKKGWILNKTSARALADALGPETNDWKGAKIILHAPMINAFGKTMRAVRVKRVIGNNGQETDIVDEPTQDELLETVPNGAYQD